MEKTTSESWLQHIAVWGESGLNKAEFCRQAGLHYKKFCYHSRLAEIAVSAENTFVALASAQLDTTPAQLSNALTCDNASTESWVQHIVAWKENDLSKAKFCRQAGLHYQKFCYYCRRAEIVAPAENTFVALAPTQPSNASIQLSNTLTCGNYSVTLYEFIISGSDISANIF